MKTSTKAFALLLGTLLLVSKCNLKIRGKFVIGPSEVASVIKRQSSLEVDQPQKKKKGLSFEEFIRPQKFDFKWLSDHIKTYTVAYTVAFAGAYLVYHNEAFQLNKTIDKILRDILGYMLACLSFTMVAFNMCQLNYLLKDKWKNTDGNRPKSLVRILLFIGIVAIQFGLYFAIFTVSENKIRSDVQKEAITNCARRT